jgi:hypothetical protein
MHIAKAKRSFDQQRTGAKNRGIEWRLTFEEWCSWWGTDIDNRGTRPWNLQMQRLCDQGPYALDNIRKGSPQQNAKTRGAMLRLKACAAAKARLQAQLDAAMWLPSAPPKEDLGFNPMLPSDAPLLERV